MKSINTIWFLSFAVLLIGAGCSSGDSSSPSPVYPTSNLPNGPTLTAISGSNVMSLSIDGANCSAATSSGYPNKPCVSVTICSISNPATCQTINDILLDTGSYGLRLFRSVINNNIALSPETRGTKTIAECVQYGDGSSDWGPVEFANVVLGSEPSVQVPIQVIDASYVGASNCSGTNSGGPDSSPSEAGFNGILGVGLFAQDCGAGCATDPTNGNYFSCTTTSCSEAVEPLSNQVTNPVTALTTDNNGVILELPSVPYGGLAGVEGYLVLGINTESNNAPSGVTGYPADPGSGNFSTVFNSQTFSTSFLDSGSNGIFLTSPGNTVPDCSDSSGWFCPASTQTYTAVSSGYNGSPSTTIPFYIGNFDQLYNTNNNVFIEIAGDGGGDFDWGLPFYFGRNTFIGFENTSTSLGTGPYWAF